MELDDQQRTAVETTSRKALVLAGAGSGKTRVITERVAYLVEKEKVSPYEIMQFTFTRRAAQVMATRLESRIGYPAHRIAIGTMHGLALGYLKRFGDVIGFKPRHITVYCEWEAQYLLKETAKDMGLYKKRSWKIPKKEINKVFNDYYDSGIEPEESDQCYPLFQAFMKRCKENQSLTYGGLLVGMNLLIPTIAKHLHIRHILVDEVQDINATQWNIINGMVDAFGASLFVVGDIDQSVYKFRGAVPEYLIEHQDDFDIFRIETNYRSDANIVNMANCLIEHNENRLEKTMRPFEDAQTEVLIVENTDSQGIINLYKTMNEKSPDIPRAILCRIHAPLKKMSRLMDDEGIEHVYYGKKTEITNSEQFRRFHAFLKLLVNPFDNFAFLLIRELIGLSLDDYNRIRLIASEDGTSHFQAYGYADIDVDNYFDWSPRDASGENLDDVSIRLNNTLPWNAAEIEGVETDSYLFIQDWLKDNPAGTIGEYLDWLATFDLQDEMKDEPEGLQLLTIHGCKGLEFPTVIVAGCNEGILPSKQAIVNDEVGDERNLMYVAMTRAEDTLILTIRPESKEDERGRVHLSPQSRFIGELQ